MTLRDSEAMKEISERMGIIVRLVVTGNEMA